MNVMELEGNALLTIPADQDSGSIDLDRSSTLDLLSQCQTDMQGAVIIYDNESQDEKVVKIVTKTECDTSMDGYVSPDDFENLITLHAPPSIKDEIVEEDFKPSVMDHSATNVCTTSVTTPNTSITSVATTNVSTTNVSTTNVSTNEVSTKIEKPETTTDVSTASDAQASLNISSEADVEGDTDDDETIATFVTSTGQQLALYAVEDSDEIYAVALYDESGEPPTNFHFLMKEDVERLIGEGAVKTVKRPSAQSKKDTPKSSGPKEEIKFERRQPQLETSASIKTEKEIKKEVLETPESHTVEDIIEMPIIEEPPPACGTPITTVGSNAPLASEPPKTTAATGILQAPSTPEVSQKLVGQVIKTTASPLLGRGTKTGAQVGQASKVLSSPSTVRSANTPSKVCTTPQSVQAVSTTVSTTPQMKQTPQSRKITPRPGQVGNVSSSPQMRQTTPQSRQIVKVTTTPQMRQATPQSGQAANVSLTSQIKQTTPQSGQAARVSTTPQMRQTTPQSKQGTRILTTPQMKQTNSPVTPQSGQTLKKTPQLGQAMTVSVTPRSGQPTRILTTPQSKQTTKVVPVSKANPQRIIYKQVVQAGPRSSQNLCVLPVSQNQKPQTAPRIFQVQKPQGITTIAYVQKTQSAGFPLQQKPQTIIYQAQRIQGGKGTPQFQKVAGNKSTLQMTKPQIIRGNAQAPKAQIIRNVSQPYRVQTGEITQAYKTHLIKSGQYIPKAQVITEVPNRMMKFEVAKGQASRQFQVHQQPKFQPMKNIITKTYAVNAKSPSLARGSPASKPILSKTIKQNPSQLKSQTKSNHSYVITNDSESHTLDNTIEEIDSDVEIIEESTVQYILCDSIPSDSELTFDELQKSLQSFKMNKSETTKDKENSNIVRPGKTKDTIIKFSKVSKPTIQITSQNKQPTPAPQSDSKSPKKPRSTSNMLHRKIKKEVVDPEYGDVEEEHISSDDMSRSRLDSSAAESSMNASKVKRSRKQQFTAVERTDSEIIIQPASAFSEGEDDVSTSKKRGRKKKKLSPDPDYNPRQANKKGKKLQKSVEVIDLDEDEGEKEKSGKSKGSSDKENNVISLEDSDGDHEESSKKSPRKKAMTLMQCCHCEKNFKKRPLLERHLRACPDSPIYVQKDVEKKAPSGGKAYPCKHCGEIFYTVVDIARHARMNHRRKGRPSQSKSTGKKSASSDEETSTVENPTGHSLRRGRRPTKRNLSPDISEAKSTEQKVNSSDEAPTKTRRRGRPPKKDLKKESTPEVRRRGRPPKKSIAKVDAIEEKQDNEDQDGEEDDEKEEEKDLNSEEKEESEEKDLNSEEKEQAEEKDLNSGEKEEKIEQESKTTNDRNDEANKEEVISKGVDEADNDDSQQPEKSKEDNTIPKTPTQPPKKRGRPSKRKSSLDEEKESSSADQKDDASSENVAEPRKRGRPSRKSSVNDDTTIASAAADDVEKNLESMFKDT